MIDATVNVAAGGTYTVAATGLLADIFVLFNNLLALLGFGFGED
mgnify:CR=1 FL=1